MIQTEIFRATNDEKGLQEKLNNWLNENPNIEIITVLQSQSGRLERNVVITIFYK